MRAAEILRIANTKVFFGPGPKLLFEKIEELHSLRKASMESGISYTKALRMLRTIEQQVGMAVVHSTKGGSGRGGSQLTPLGKQLLLAYENAQAEVRKMTQQIVDDHFSFLDSP